MPEAAGVAAPPPPRVTAALSDESRRRVRAALAVGRRVPHMDGARVSASIRSAARALVRDARSQRQAVEWAIVQLKQLVDALPCPPNDREARAKVRARLVAAVIKTYYAGAPARARRGD